MILKDKITSEPGFQYVIECMELMSSAGRRRMMQQPFITDQMELTREYDRMDQVCTLLHRDECRHSVEIIRHQLMQMHDLQGTIANLHKGVTLEEIELFEIKSFTFLCMESVKSAHDLGIDSILSIPDTSAVFRILDPDGTGIPNFYIYDSYHPQLPELRKQLKAKQSLLDSSNATSEENATLQKEVNDLFERQNSIQQQIIQQLSEQLQPFHTLLDNALNQMAYTDFLMAKATLSVKWGLTRPCINDHQSQFVRIWNPRLKHHNERQGLRYQPVDITLEQGVCLITGANMAGKTVLLKTVGIAQLMAQTGFFIPASEASIRLYDDIIFCIGDEQNEMNGLSSFASEIIKISDTLTRSEKEKLLILIDEPARTTNPVEGKAIVQAVSTLLNNRNSTALITTHYSQLGIDCRRLRVKGFVEEMADAPISPDNINRFMDYTLIPDNSDEVPQEALRIATILNCNPFLLQTIKSFL